jgi:hypothetical protein
MPGVTVPSGSTGSGAGVTTSGSGGLGAACGIGLPHVPQKRACGSFSEPQTAHLTMSAQCKAAETRTVDSAA